MKGMRSDTRSLLGCRAAGPIRLRLSVSVGQPRAPGGQTGDVVNTPSYVETIGTEELRAELGRLLRLGLPATETSAG